MSSPILVTGAAGRVGGVGRKIVELLLKQGKAVRALVRNEDPRAQTLRDMGAQVVAGDLLDLDSMHRAIAGCETMYFGMSVSDSYLAATVNVAAVAKHHGVKAFIGQRPVIKKSDDWGADKTFNGESVLGLSASRGVREVFCQF